MNIYIFSLQGLSALEYACKSQHVSIAVLLIAAGAEVHISHGQSTVCIV